MRSFGRAGCALAILCLAGGAAPAQEAQHLRGTLAAIEDGVLTVVNEDEEEVQVALTEDTGIYLVTPAKFADIEVGQFVGVTSVEQDEERVALEVHVFAEDLRGTGEGHFPWDLVKEPNTMTNATIAEIEEVGDQRELQVRYKQGEGEQKTEGSQAIYVPDDLSVVKMEKASDRSVLKPGKEAFLVVRDGADGSRTVLAVVVGDEGATPPM